MKNMFRAVSAGIFLAFIISCGGGGGTTTQTVTPPPPPPPGTTFPNDTSKAQALPIRMGTTGGNSTDSTTNTGNNTITCCSGTLGALISKGGNFFILSNNHVLDKSDQGKPGDPITQPGLVDNQCKGGALVATMSQAAPLTTSNVDAAIAQIVPGTVDTSGSILDLGVADAATATIAPAPPSSILAAPTIGLAVAKAGRSTGLTCSTINSVLTNVKVDYSTQCGNGGTTFSVTFTNQVVISGGNFSAAGDSGALVVTKDTARPVALLFAGNTTSTTANPIQDVIAAFGGFTIVGGGDHAVSCATTATVSSAITSNGPSSAKLSSDETQRAILVKDKYADQLMQDGAITAVEAGASADNPKEGALVIHVNGTPSAPVPQHLDGLRTRIMQSAAQKSVSVAAPDVERASGVKDAHADSLMAQEGIVGVGVGASADSPGEPALVIYTEAGKQPVIPAVIDGVRTKVVEGERFRTFNWGKESKAPVSCPKPKAVSVKHSVR